MNRQNISQIVRELFRDNYNLYPESYPLTEGGLMSEEGKICAQEVARGYWDVREEAEIERDEKAGVTENDYIEWVMSALSGLIPSPNKFQTWAAEINKDWTKPYTATAAEDALTVHFDSVQVARIDYDNGRYTVTGSDIDAVASLEYMVAR